MNYYYFQIPFDFPDVDESNEASKKFATIATQKNRRKKEILTFGSGRWSAQTRDFLLGRALLALRSQNANVNVAVAAMSIGIDENSRSRRFFDFAYCRSAATFTKNKNVRVANSPTPPPFCHFLLPIISPTYTSGTARDTVDIDSCFEAPRDGAL